ncbi:MAG: MFS transporter [Anaerolineae bacterium]|nr:MFS transporter [Anaerolineae bacterium]
MRKDARNPQTVVFMYGRMVVNINTRMVYPFLSTFARGLGVDMTAISHVVTVRALLGAVSPFLAQIAEQRGRKTGILLGMGLYLISVSMVFAVPLYTVFFLSQIVGTLGFYLYMSSTQAYLGDQVPYQKRGTAMAMFELGWPLAFIFGMPMVSFWMGRYGWLGPYPALILLGVIALALLLRFIPRDPHEGRSAISVWKNFGQVVSSPMALTALLLSFSFSVANEVVNLVFGVWLESSFGIKLIALGAASAVIGLAEFGGDSLSATVADRLGKRRVVRFGMILNGLVALSLPWMGQKLWGAIIGLFLFYITFEFSVTSSMPMISELLPSARATLLGANTAAYSLGRACGALLAPWLYALGFHANVVVAAFMVMVSLLALSRIRIKIPEPVM